VIPKDVLRPVQLRVTGEERVRVPAGTFDCWRMTISHSGGVIDYWVRKSDGIAVRLVERTRRPAGGRARRDVGEPKRHVTFAPRRAFESIRPATRCDMSRWSSALSTILIALVATPVAASAQQQQPAVEEYAVDVGHSIIEFSIPFAFTRVKGRFTEWTGTILYDRANPASSSVTAVIDAKSIDTGWPHRDEHLRTSDFFDVERFPKIIFQSDRLRPRRRAGSPTAADHARRDEERLVADPTRGGSPQRGPESNNLLLDAASESRIARKDFGITGGSQYNSWFTAARAARWATASRSRSRSKGGCRTS
jgi:polyisoprenoid-binding protein YceI